MENIKQEFEYVQELIALVDSELDNDGISKRYRDILMAARLGLIGQLMEINERLKKYLVVLEKLKELV